MEEILRKYCVLSQDTSAFESYIFPTIEGSSSKAKIGQRLGVPFTRTLQPKVSIKLGENELSVNQDGNGVLGISGVIWDAALYLIDFLSTVAKKFPDNNLEDVLDVGTGTGICGIAATLLGAKRVILTDVNETSSLEANMRELPEQHKSKITFLPYSWGTVPVPKAILHPTPEKSDWDILLCSDLIYDEKHHQSLLQFLTSITFKCMIFSYKKRSEPAEKLFFQQLAQHYQIYIINPEFIDVQNISRDSLENGLYLLFIIPSINTTATDSADI